MASLIPGYAYDIFISYRHNDNRSGWVTEFVKNLQEELAATIKDPITLYFDADPKDALLEMHHVDKSVAGKLKCLIFIPIISQTYCDPKSFAWSEEFCAFNGSSAKDRFGRDVRLLNGNVVSRILPVKVHNLDADDMGVLCDETGGPLRAIDFTYKEPGVNRPLRPSDEVLDNVNKTRYWNQVNKTANCVKEIITSLRHIDALISENPLVNSLIENEKQHDSYRGFVTSNHSVGSKKSIIVLPFENISSDKNNEYFSDGLTEEIIADLSNVNDLSVISRSSAMSFKGTKKRIREIAQEVGVQYVLEGSVRKENGHLRITAQLIDGISDAHMWAEKFSGTVEDVFSIQEKVSRSIVDVLKLKLSRAEKDRIGSRPVENIEAYELCLKAQYEFYRFKEDALLRAIQYLEAASKIVGANAYIYKNMGFIYCNLFNVASNFQVVYLQKAEDLANKIFALQPDSAEGHSLLGFICAFKGSKRKMVNHLERAYQENPNDSNTLVILSLGYFLCGRADSAVNVLNQLNTIDPFNPVYNVIMALANCAKGKFDVALEWSRASYEKHPDVPQSKLYYAYFLACNHFREESYLVFDRLIADESGTIFAPLGSFLKYSLQGKKRKAMDSLPEDIKIKMMQDPEWSWLIADGYAMIHENEEAINWIESMVNQDFLNYPLLAHHDIFFESIRAEPRFKKLAERVRIGWEEFYPEARRIR